MKKLFLLNLLFILSVYPVLAQRITEIGLTGGAARFYPEAQHMGANRNNSMDNDWGWSAGVFIEDHWKPKIHQIVEINFYKLSSDVFLQKNPEGPWGIGDERQPIYGNYDNTSFSQIAISGGIKYFLNKKLFVYPGFEFARALNSDVDINKTTYNLKLGGGVNLRGVDILLEYAYGLKYQRIVYDPTVPFATTHRNTYLQLKVQIPLYRLR
ncbi:hypothetical protein [Maribellus maritimus]|uniref:hypothetical protein n=1 Tax=Maribellus maritimus TaxID=2870838 RepID=UPI001EEADC65|nr:hypothetical protein [Maribellus maritimus]MCG6188194.1 hypothetical protein [Maribellus maritimus]